MDDNTVHVSNTPIFDQLARERGYERMIANGPVNLRPVFKNFKQPLPQRTRSYTAPGAWIVKPVPRMGPETVSVSDNLDPASLVQAYINPVDFVRDLTEEFNERYPNARNIEVSAVNEINGSVTYTVSGKLGGWLPEPTAEQMLKEMSTSPFERATLEYFAGKKGGPDKVRQKSRGVKLHPRPSELYPDLAMVSLSGTGARDLVVQEHKTDVVREDLASRQLALYRSIGSEQMHIDQDTIRTDLQPQTSTTWEDLADAYKKYRPNDLVARVVSSPTHLTNANQYDPEQTDQSASTDDHSQGAEVQPLWRINGDTADEE